MKQGLRQTLLSVLGRTLATGVSGAGIAMMHEAGIPTDSETQLRQAQTGYYNAEANTLNQATKPILLTDPSTGKPLYDQNGAVQMGSLAQQKEMNDTFKVTGGTVPVPEAFARAHGFPELAGHPISANSLAAIIKSDDKQETLDGLISDAAKRAISAGKDPNQTPEVQQLLSIRAQTQKEGQPTQAATDGSYIDLSQKKALGQPLTPAETAWMGAYEKQRSLVPNIKVAAGEPARNDARLDRSYQFNSGQLEKLGTPIDSTIQRLGRLQDTLAQNSPQADALVAPELLTVMAGGQGSGLRMNEAEISRIVGGRSQWENLKAAAQKWSTNPATANSITADQRQQIHALVTAVSGKLAQKQQILNDSRQGLINATDPTQHRQILANTQQRLANVDQSAGGFNVTDPRGVTHTFPDQASADNFKRLAHIQ